MPAYLEDLREGAEYRSAARMITGRDIAVFAELSGDFSPLHTDDDWVRENTPFSGRIAHGALVFAVSQGLRTPVVDDIAVIAFLEFERTLAGPVYPGDVIMARWTVADVRRSRSSPDRGVVRLLVDVVNQDGTVVQRGRDTYLASARPLSGVEPGAALGVGPGAAPGAGSPGQVTPREAARR
jgi:3-hydroxybutyryl-CoA dehydratase